MRTELARAKINLTLHVGRVIKDPHDPFCNYHPLDSLVVFADIGDFVTLQKAEIPGLTITGPFSEHLSATPDNLIMRALSVADEAPCHVTLEKNLPIAAANAAAILRLLNLTDPHIAIDLGADVPVCLVSSTAHMTGIGEDVTPLPGLGRLYALLVNPGVAVSTADIFRAFDSSAPRDTPRPQKPDGSLLERALDGRNDLESIAIAKEPVIGNVLAALSRQTGCQLARMSGSGATCFAIFDNETHQGQAEQAIKNEHPDWWVARTRLGETS